MTPEQLADAIVVAALALIKNPDDVEARDAFREAVRTLVIWTTIP